MQNNGLQCQTKVHLPVADILAKTLVVSVWDSKQLLYTFLCCLNNAHSLIEGTQVACVLDTPFSPAGGSSVSISKPNSLPAKVFIQLDYLNSIYTRKEGLGEFRLLIKSWTTGNGETLPNSTYARVKMIDTKGNIVTQVKKWDDKMLLGEEKILETTELMQQVSLTLFQPGGFFFGEKEVGSITMYVADLMSNARIAAIIQRYYQTEFVDKDCTNMIHLSVQQLFIPTKYSKAEWDEWEANKARIGQEILPTRMNKAKNLITRTTSKDLEEKEQLGKQELSKKKKKFKYLAADYQGFDLFTLGGKPNKAKMNSIQERLLKFQFSEKPKGVLVIMLQELNISEGNDGIERNLYMTISTNREVHRTRTVYCDDKTLPNWGMDTVRVRTQESDDQIFVKIFDEADPNFVLSSATLRPLALLLDKPAFQRLSAELKFKGQFVGNMSIDIMYRSSEFTRSPQGNLHLTLAKAIGMMNKTEEYSPMMEIIVNNQRIWIDEKLTTKQERYRGEGASRRWSTQKELTLQTQSISDCIIIKFYGRQIDKTSTDIVEGGAEVVDEQTESKGQLVLLGCEQFDLSALVLSKVDPLAVVAHGQAHKTQGGAKERTTELGKGADICEFENLISIDLKRVNPSMSGEISIKCDYRPRVYPEGAGALGRLDVTSKLREQMIKTMAPGGKTKIEGQEQEGSELQPKSKGNKKDASSLAYPPSSPATMKAQVCFMSLDSIQLKNLDARRSLNLRHLMVEVSYLKSKIISRTTINLGLTRNREVVGERFQINLKDLSGKIIVNPNMQIYDDHDILVKAFSINNRTEGHEADEDDTDAEKNSQKQLIGIQRINPAQFRQLQNTELKLNVAIPVKNGFSQVDPESVGAEQADEEENGEVDDFSNMADSLLNKMDQALGDMQETRGDKHGGAKKYILVQLTALATQTRVTRNPLGILSFSDLQLCNLDKHIKDLNLDKNLLTLEIEANGNLLRSENAIKKNWESQKIKKLEYQNAQSQNQDGDPQTQKTEIDRCCLWPSDGNSSTFFKEGRAYYFNSALETQSEEEPGSKLAKLKPTADEVNCHVWEQPAMFSVFTSSGADQVSIALVLESHEKHEKEAASGTDLRSDECTDTDKTKCRSKRQVIGRAKLSIAALSLYMENQVSGKGTSIGIEMDYQALSEDVINVTELQVHRKLDTEPEGKDSSKKSSFYNLLGSRYDGKLIMTLELNYNVETIKEAKELKNLKHNQNQFMLPEVVEYKDYINTGFDAMMRKQKRAKEQQKIGKIQSGELGGAEQTHTHMLAEISLEALDSYLHKFAETGKHFGFFAVEPLYQVFKGHVPDYLQALQAKDQMHSAMQKDPKQQLELRNYQLSKSLGDITDDLIVSTQHMMTPAMQISPIFALQNYEKQLLDEKVVCWLGSGVTKIVVSIVVEKGKKTRLSQFRKRLSTLPLMQNYTILGIYECEVDASALVAKDKERQGPGIELYQAVIDLAGALKSERKGPLGRQGSYFMKALTSSSLSQSICFSKFTAEGGDNLMANHQTISRATFKTKITASDFVDCPAGDLNVIIKSISTNNHSIFCAKHDGLKTHYMRVSMLSQVGEDKILIDHSHKKDVCDSSLFKDYSSKPSTEDDFNTLLMNHVSNMLSRHFSDKILIQILCTSEPRSNIVTGKQEDRVLAQTIIPLSQLSLVNRKAQSFNVITLGSQRIKQKPIYYKIELDVIFHSKTNKSPSQSALEQATENYKLMMGKDSLTPMELEILKMLMERAAIATKLTPTCLRMRKARFFIRNLQRVEYKTIDDGQRVRLLVSPLTFLFQVFNASQFSRAYDHYRTLALRQRVEKEFKSCRPLDRNMIEALERTKQGMEETGSDGFINFKAGNLLEIQMPPEGLDLEAYKVKIPNQPMTIKKLVFIIQTQLVGKPAQTVYERQFSESRLLKMGSILQNEVITIENVAVGVEIKFALMQVQHSEIVARSTKAKKEVLRPLGTAGSLYLSEYTEQLRNSVWIQSSLALCKNQLPLKFRVLQNSLTSHPHRVIEVVFHRFIKLDKDADFRRHEPQNAENEDQYREYLTKPRKHTPGEKVAMTTNNIKMGLVEDPCIEKLNDIVRAKDLVALDDEERGGEATGPRTESVQKGSINDMIKQQTKEEQMSGTANKYNLYVDYDSCEPYKGTYLSSERLDINKFGKTVDAEISKFEINNTSAANKIRFKIFRDGSRQLERLREFGIGMQAGTSSSERQEIGLLAEAEVSIAHLSGFYVNQPVSLVYPVTQVKNPDSDPKGLNYKIENVYVLFTVTVTDKTFGELLIGLDEFRGLPECKTIREMQYRVMVLPSATSITPQALKSEKKKSAQKPTEKEAANALKAGKEQNEAALAPRIEPTFVHESARVPYEIANLSHLSVTRELVIPVKMKDVFSNRRLFMSNSAKEIYHDLDQRIFLELYGIDQHNTKMLVGQLELSLVEVIQGNMADQDERSASERRQRAKEQREEEAAKKQAAQKAEAEADPKKTAALPEEISGRSQALEQAEAKRVAEAQGEAKRHSEHRQALRKMKKADCSEADIKKANDEYEATKAARQNPPALAEEDQENFDSQNAAAKSQRSQKSQRSEQPEEQKAIPEGYSEQLLPNVEQTANKDELGLFGDRPEELVNYQPGVKLITQIGWQFSFQQREQKTDAYYENQAEQQELERTRRKKEIPNILKTFGKLRGDKDLLNKNMDMLSLVLASESCNLADGTDPEAHKVLSNIPSLLMAFRSIFIEFTGGQLPVASTISLMKCCLYMKIICKNTSAKQLEVFTLAFNKAGIFSFVFEMFDEYSSKSRLLTLKILSFITFMISDIFSLYFEHMSGVRLDNLIGYVRKTEENMKDTEIVAYHSRLVNSCCHCLFEYKIEEGDEDRARLAKKDMERLAANIYDCIQSLIVGEVNTQYKQDYENLAKLLCESSIRFIHLSIQKYQLLKSDAPAGSKDAPTTLTKIFEALLTIIVDSIASGLSLDFVKNTMKMLRYEISLITQMSIKQELNLLFDSGTTLSLLQKLLDVYSAHLENNAKRAAGTLEGDEDQVKDTAAYFDDCKAILEFYADEACMNSFGENNTQLIKKTLSDPMTSNSEDFIIFLHKVVQADIDNESEVEGETAQQRKMRVRQERYGGLNKINKFSLSHIEWIEEQMPELL